MKRFASQLLLAVCALACSALMTAEMWRRASRSERMSYRVTRHPLTILCAYLTIFFFSVTLLPLLRRPSRYWDSVLALLAYGAALAALWLLGGFRRTVLRAPAADDDGRRARRVSVPCAAQLPRNAHPSGCGVDGGLIAPAIHDVANKTLDEVMTALRDLVNRVRSGGLRRLRALRSDDHGDQPRRPRMRERVPDHLPAAGSHRRFRLDRRAAVGGERNGRCAPCHPRLARRRSPRQRRPSGRAVFSAPSASCFRNQRVCDHASARLPDGRHP